ncbi:sugar ABC transporter ATP-binding protein [Gulosibacter sp. 10]|uniref:sugar ABC transporter ATP-binding protein n=1 Tax=Gulosibacter sp. 10 TaxID=1255570 RepID=UPI00097EEED8|nr:sugar ABC transporter ATP-binding protein [Gulosibacter sp. 10]SJM67382.1 Ribose ABC transport system, ATP-binding protein RbsA (TC 3.A.1.2.1) [Gulosibacter sp. 10]
MTAPILQFEAITKRFPGVRVLDGVSFDLHPGEVHALMGENGAGKSTLMKILMGIYRPDSGRILIEGEPVEITGPSDALSRGVAMIHQELNPVLDMTVAENLYLGRELRNKLGLADARAMRAATRELLERLEIPVAADRLMRTLSVAQMQLVEIAKAIAFESKVIVMDEPTSAITEADVEILFRHIGRLRESGVAIIYISHKMEEIFRISDTISVLRDGALISTAPASELDEATLIRDMVGRSLDENFPKREVEIGEPVLEIDHWSSPPMVQDVSISLRKGEVLGIGGLVGAGRSEFVESFFGIRPGGSDSPVLLNGEPVRIKRPQDAIRRGIALVTEDRKVTGLNLEGSVAENISLVNLKQLFPSTILRQRTEARIADDYIDRLRIRTPNSRQLVSRLSGGNQQKVVLSKWLLTEPQIIIFDDPTRGIDIGAKRDIYTLIGDLVEKGCSVILISSEMTELMGLSDRIHVFAEGRITGTLERPEFDQERILELASQFGDNNDDGTH